MRSLPVAALCLALASCSSARFPEGSSVAITGACAVRLPVVVEALDVASTQVDERGQRLSARASFLGQLADTDEGYGYEFDSDDDRGTSIWFHFVDGELAELTWEVTTPAPDSRIGFDPHTVRIRPGPRAEGSAQVPDGAFVGGRWETVRVKSKSGFTEFKVRFASERFEVELSEQIYVGQCDWDPPPKA